MQRERKKTPSCISDFPDKRIFFRRFFFLRRFLLLFLNEFFLDILPYKHHYHTFQKIVIFFCSILLRNTNRKLTLISVCYLKMSLLYIFQTIYGTKQLPPSSHHYLVVCPQGVLPSALLQCYIIMNRKRHLHESLDFASNYIHSSHFLFNSISSLPHRSPSL